MDKLELDGIQYVRYNNKWADASGMIVSAIMQDRPNRLYIQSLDLSAMRIKEVISTGDRFKRSNSIGLAIKCYDHVMTCAGKNDVIYILPRLTSCYRAQGMPQRVIDTLTFAKERFGADVITAVLLTSAAAAYCDMGDYDKAKKCCDRAYAMSNGKASGELSMVYKRIRANTKG